MKQAPLPAEWEHYRDFMPLVILLPQVSIGSPSESPRYSEHCGWICLWHFGSGAFFYFPPNNVNSAGTVILVALRSLECREGWRWRLMRHPVRASNISDFLRRGFLELGPLSIQIRLCLVDIGPLLGRSWWPLLESSGTVHKLLNLVILQSKTSGHGSVRLFWIYFHRSN